MPAAALTRRAALGALAATALAPAVPARGPAAYPAPDHEAMLPVPGGRVYVRVNGDLAGPRLPLVFVHGGPGGTHAAYLDALALSDERAVILYDQLDSGRSDRPDDPANWTVPRFVDELEAVRAGLNLPRWHVCGHSWGGTIALEYGARRPAELAGLILASPLISTPIWLSDAEVLVGRLPRATQDTLARCDRPAPPPQATCDAATDIFYKRFNRREPPTPATLAYKRDGGGGNDRLYETMWGRSEFVSTGTLRDYDGEPLLARLDGRRTLFITGQHDEARPETVRAFAGEVPHKAMFAEVPGAAHGIFSDRPEATLAILRPWLARQDRA